MKFSTLIIACLTVYTVEAAVGINFYEILKSDRPNYPDVDYYDCAGRNDTMETHPFDCTRFIKCDNGRAQDMACAKCHEHPISCPLGYLHWDQPGQICDFGDRTACDNPPTDPPTTPPTDPPATTPAPECDEDCVEEGDCNSYRVCQGGKWESRTCDAETWWNPAAGPHGGSCDFWDNLSDEVQEKYRDDETCPVPVLPCYWREDGECDNKYYWLPENQRSNKTEVHVSCPASEGVSLVWNQSKKGCFHCTPAGSCTFC